MVRKIKGKIYNRLKKFSENTFPYYCYKSGFLSSLYYAISSSAFRREHKAVLSGKVKHLKEENNYFLLIRNTHRLEKGLLMKPRRATFGKSFIEETVINFEKICKADVKYSENHQLKWSHDVLKKYFDVIELDEHTSSLKKRFSGVIERFSNKIEGPSKIPYNRVREDFSEISYDEFYKLTKQRRSVRWFLDKKVPREIIDKAILAGSQSPSACNRQPFEYKIIDDPKLLKEVVDLPMGTKGYGHSIPVMIVVVGNLDAYFSERDRHLIYIDASLANMSFMLALETLGLSSCSINWPDIESRERKMEKFLNLEPHQRPIMCIGIGYPDLDGMVAFSEKRELKNIRKYNFE